MNVPACSPVLVGPCSEPDGLLALDLRTLRNGGSPFGPYVNHDHNAGLMEMLAPIPIVLSLGSLFRGGSTRGFRAITLGRPPGVRVRTA